MHFTARYICDYHQGRFPDDYETILSLKGVGEYTAAAIASFAFNLAYPVVDGNVMRFLSRLYGIKEPIDTTAGKKKLKDLANSLIDPKNPGEFNQAIMEFGAILCKPKNPDCDHCIFRDQCEAYAQNMISELPLKYSKTIIRKRYFHYLLFICKAQIILSKRVTRDIWQNLYDFPLLEADAFYPRNKIIETVESGFTIPESEFQIENISGNYKHVLSHQHILARFYTVKIKKEIHFQHIVSLNDKQYSDIQINNINRYPLPRLIDKYLTENQII
jgi:A/G-specific adenine glycosylase